MNLHGRMVLLITHPFKGAFFRKVGRGDTSRSKVMVSSTSILSTQATASSTQLIMFTAIMFLHGMEIGGSVCYSGLVLPHHVTNSTILYLGEDQANWFVSMAPLSQGVGVLLSIPVSEYLGRKQLFIISNFLCLLGYLGLYFASTFGILAMSKVINSIGRGEGHNLVILEYLKKNH